MPEEKIWIVTTASSRPIHEIATDLEKAGFAIDQVFDAIGSITGRSSEASIKRLQAIDGVVDVSPSTGIDIGPPGTDVTW